MCSGVILKFPLVLACLALAVTQTVAQVSVLTQHNDNLRTGANLAETKLNVSNVAAGKFGKLFTRKVTGQIYAQPLYLPALNIGGKTRPVVFVATMGDQVYAFDATDPAASNPLWTRSFINPPTVTTIPYQRLVGWTDIEPEIGILSTPVIDPVTKTMYVVYRTLEGDPDVDTNYKQRLIGLDITTGATKLGPVLLGATLPGTGDQTDGAGNVVYNGRRQNQRPALTLANGRIYIASASHGDTRPYHGWILSYNASTLAFTGAFNSTPNAGLGGFWMSGQGPAIDEQGNLYVITGNADFNPAQGSYGDSVIKLSPDLKVLDYFTPFNEQNLDNWDEDLGSCGVLLIPGTNLALAGSKEGKLYLLDRDNMGKFQAGSDDQIRQWFTAFGGHLHGSPIFYDSAEGRLVYLWSENDRLKAYKLNAQDLLDVTPYRTGQIIAPDGMPGAMLTLSSNGKTAGTPIIWASLPLTGNANQNIVPGVLRAFNALTLEEIWNSRINDSDDIGKFAKYCPPTVADGYVFMATFSNELAVYGLVPPLPPEAPTELTANPGEGRINLAWRASPRANEYEILRALEGGKPAVIKRGIKPTNYSDTTVIPGIRYSYWVRAKNSFGTGKATGPVTASATASSATQVFSPTDDAQVMIGSKADTNFGRASTMVLDGNNVSTTRYAFLKYDLSKLGQGGVMQAKLRLYGSHWGPRPSKDSLYEINDSAWNELAITWNNMPIFGKYIGYALVDVAPAYYEWDVTAYIKALQTAGGKVANFGLMMEPKTKDDPIYWEGKRISDTFNSKEASGNRPELVITSRPSINYPNGFLGATSFVFNGAATGGAALNLTQNAFNEAGSVWHKTQLQVDRFTTQFRFRIENPDADGFAFVLQNAGTKALGFSGGGLGYAADHVGGDLGIPRSIAVKFDIYDNNGEGNNSVGVYTGGVAPTVPATALTGVDLHSGHEFDAKLKYDGSTLELTLTDLVTNATWVGSFPVDIPGALGSTIGFAGFTGGTGGLSCRPLILKWVYRL